MSTPIRVTTQIMGTTVFSTKQATLEWTPQGTIRVVQTEPGEQPVLILDVPPAGLRQVGNYTLSQSMVVLKPVQGKPVKLNLMGSMLAPEPMESADAYAMRTATIGVPPQSWWVDSLRASGVKVVDWGWKKALAIGGGVGLGLVVLIFLIAAIGASLS